MANVVVSHSRAFWRIWLLGFWLLVVASFLAVIFGIFGVSAGGAEA
jgi:hypothetical protein